MVCAHLVVYFLARVVLLCTWPEQFAELDTRSVLGAFVGGVRFDLSVAASFLGPALLALALPGKFAAHPLWRGFWGWWGFLILVVSTGILIGDICYFGLVDRHIGVELVALQNDVDLLVYMAVREYWVWLLVFAAFTLGAALAWRRLLKWDARVLTGARAPLWAPLACAPLIILAIRGQISGKPISVVNAFDSGSLAEGYLKLNGPFSVWHSSRRSSPRAVEYMPWDEAVERVRREVFTADETASHAEFPLQRSPPQPASGEERARPNVVVVLLESWDAMVVDSIRAEHGLEPLGLTPHFDALAREGVLFSRFYAAGQRSMDGMSAVLCGFPTLPGMPFLGRGMEQSRLAFIGDIARAEGYSTFFVQGSGRSSFRGDAIAALAGFDVYEGKEDIIEHQGKAPMADWGSWDEDLFAETARLAGAVRSPFLGFAFTTSTHAPFQVPSAEFERLLPTDPRARHRNSIGYADWCLGRFIERARSEGWFANTVFLLVADHTSGLEADGSPESLHHVPCLVVAPGLAPRVERRIGSQLDIVPTIMDLAGFTRPYAAFGRTLLEPEGARERGAWCIRGDLVLRIEDLGWVLHDTRRRVDARTPSEEVAAEIELRSLAFLQVATKLLRRNSVYRPDTARSPASLVLRVQGR